MANPASLISQTEAGCQRAEGSMLKGIICHALEFRVDCCNWICPVGTLLHHCAVLHWRRTGSWEPRFTPSGWGNRRFHRSLVFVSEKADWTLDRDSCMSYRCDLLLSCRAGVGAAFRRSDPDDCDSRSQPAGSFCSVSYRFHTLTPKLLQQIQRLLIVRINLQRATILLRCGRQIVQALI